jgi:hypothetical protein
VRFSATISSVVGLVKPRFGVNDTLLRILVMYENSFLRLTFLGVVKHQLLVESVARIAAKPKIECMKDHATILNHKKVWDC